MFYLQEELLRERTRNSVLLEQRKPINIHRWRCLEVTDLFGAVCGDQHEAILLLFYFILFYLFVIYIHLFISFCNLPQSDVTISTVD